MKLGLRESPKGRWENGIGKEGTAIASQTPGGMQALFVKPS